MKYPIYLLFVVMIFCYSCAESTKNSDDIETPSSSKTTLAVEPINPKNIATLLELFPEVNFPIQFDSTFFAKTATTDVPEEVASQFFDVDIIDFGGEEMPNASIGAIGRFYTSEGLPAFLYTHKSLPVGSGDDDSVMCRIYNGSGEKAHTHILAMNSGWDGGFVQQYITLEDNVTFSGTYYRQEENPQTEIPSITQNQFAIKLNGNGSIIEKSGR